MNIFLHKQIRWVPVICAVLFVCIAHTAEAAVIYAVSTKNTLHVGETFTLDVMLDPEKVSINALSGELNFPSELVQIKSISLKNSVVSLWVKGPEQTDGGKITWSALLPGGFDGVSGAFYPDKRSGSIFSVTFVATSLGEGLVSFVHNDVYAHDGKGSVLHVETNPFAIAVQSGPARVEPEAEHLITKGTLHISASITRSPFIGANNVWFLAFGGNQGVGDVDHYEVVESRNPNPDAVDESLWKKVESPYILSDQTRRSYVYLKSVGDEHVDVLTLYPLTNKTSAVFWDILIGIALVFLGTFLWKRYVKKTT